MFFRLDQQIYMVAGGNSGPGISHDKDCNVYLIEGEKEAFLIDSGSGIDTLRILNNIKETGCALEKITHLFVTHAHGDHGGGASDMKTYLPKLKILASAGEKRLLEEGTDEELGLVAAKRNGAYPLRYRYNHCSVDKVVQDEATYEVGGASVTGILLPGHSVESVCYLVKKNGRKYLFSGDSIYLNGTLSLINCYGSTMQGYRENIEKFAGRDIDALIPSHFRLTMQNGQEHVNKAIELLSFSSLPPMM